MHNLTHRSYLYIAIPLIVSTITTPLLGVVDTAIVGQLSDPAYIGGVAVGTTIFNTLYWLFGFLRVSTTGFTAQAYGAKDEERWYFSFARPFVIALIIGMLFILCQQWMKQMAFAFIEPPERVYLFTEQYFSIRIWGAPFALGSYVIIGWFMGMQKVKTSLFLQVFTNVLNIFLDVLFVNVFHLAVQGVAIATVMAEILSCVIGVYLLYRCRFRFSVLFYKEVWNRSELRKMMLVNKDLMIRTVCLLMVLNLFTAKGAEFGTEILAANAVLIQIHFIMAYFLDGLANASSLFIGQAIGAKDRMLYKQTLYLSGVWAVVFSVCISLVYMMADSVIISLFTNSEQVVHLAKTYSPWVNVFPIAASFGLVFYGVFTGAAETAPVRNSMILSLMLYMIVYYICIPIWENNGLWLAFIAFSIGRSLFLLLYVHKLTKKLFS